MEDETLYTAGYEHEKPAGHEIEYRGFGAIRDEQMERSIDLNEQLIRNKPATFFFRMNGDAMSAAGIFNGDILILDRSLKTANGKVVLAILNGEMLVRRFEQTMNKIRLIPETKKLSPI